MTERPPKSTKSGYRDSSSGKFNTTKTNKKKGGSGSSESVKKKK